MTTLIQNYIAVIGLLVLILIFAIYVYITPAAETFDGGAPAKQENTRKQQ